MENHEFADLFPLMEGDEFQAIKDSIRLHGQRETIKLLAGKILDGRNRFRACTQLKINPRFEHLPADTDALDYVIDANLHRRHLKPEQQAFIAAEAANIVNGSNQYKKKEGSPIGQPTYPTMSIAQAADKFDVPERTLVKAKRVQDKGIPELKQAVLDDEIPMSKADVIAGLPYEDQPAAIEEVKEKKRPNKNKADAPKEEIEPKTNGEIKERGVGVIRAREACDILSRIPKNDALRKRGFQIVTDWLKDHR